MKTLILNFVLAFLFQLAQGQEKVQSLEGSWSIVECKQVTEFGSRKIMEAEIQDGNAVTDFTFIKGGKFKQVSNMEGTGTMDTYEGSWKISGNQLLITLQVGVQSMDVDYTFEQKNDLLILSHWSPDGKTNIINTFKRK